MTEVERTAEERRARRMAELDDGGSVSAGGLSVALQKFPPPDVSGLTPEEEAVAIKKWIDEITAWQRETAANPSGLVPRADTKPTQAPVA